MGVLAMGGAQATFYKGCGHAYSEASVRRSGQVGSS